MGNLKRIFFSAGEVSGDYYASCLAKEIHSINPTIEMVGIGGERMKDAGVKIQFDFISLSSIGLVESVLPGLKISFSLRALHHYLKNHPVDVIVLIDNQGMNLPLARLGKSLNIPVIYFFPPQISIWGGWNSKKVAKTVDLILTPFYDDYVLYQKAGGNVRYVGHPLLELVHTEKPKEELAHSLNISTDYVIGLFPGSRKQEIKRLFPVLLETARLIHTQYSVTFLVPISSKYFLPYLQRLLLPYGELDVVFIQQADYNAYQLCNTAIVSSGTVTLELALLKIPMIVVYQVNFLTYQLAKLLVKKRWISLPNILLNEEIVSELIQRDMKPGIILNEVDKLLNDPKYYSEKQDKLQRLSFLLGKGNTLDVVTTEILNLVFK